MTAPAVLTREEAARLMAVSVDTVDRLRAAGQIQGFRAGKRLVRFRLAELQAFMERPCDTPSPRMAWREDNRRVSNGEQFLSATASALAHPVSRQWKGYWQRYASNRQ